MSRQDAEDAAAATTGAKDLAAIFGVSRECINQWVSAGMPKAKKGVYNIRDCVTWRIERLVEGLDRPVAELTRERRLLITAQTRGYELSNAAKASELLPASDVLDDVAHYQRLTADALDNLVIRATEAVAAAGGDPVTVRRAVQVACRAARVDLAKAFSEYGETLTGDPPKRSNGNGTG